MRTRQRKTMRRNRKDRKTRNRKTRYGKSGGFTNALRHGTSLFEQSPNLKLEDLRPKTNLPNGVNIRNATNFVSADVFNMRIIQDHLSVLDHIVSLRGTPLSLHVDHPVSNVDDTVWKQLGAFLHYASAYPDVLKVWCTETLYRILHGSDMGTLTDIVDLETMCHEMIDTSVLKLAARMGSIYLLQQGMRKGLPLTPELCAEAAKGDLETLQWLRQQGCPWDSLTCATAAKANRKDIIEWARENGCPWDGTACVGAAIGGHLELLQWLRQQGCPWNAYTCAGAARAGHKHIIEWVIANGYSWEQNTCSGAAEGGHLELLQWLREKGCSWNEATCSGAAKGGHLNVLQWARSQGCPWDFWTCVEAARKDQLNILQWAIENGCPIDGVYVDEDEDEDENENEIPERDVICHASVNQPRIIAYLRNKGIWNDERIHYYKYMYIDELEPYFKPIVDILSEH
jgi:hypothetical protein